MGFGRNFRFLMGVSRSFTLIEFSGVSRLVKFNKFLRYRVDISRNLRLIDFSGFLNSSLRSKQYIIEYFYL